jgi:hypothetical protein
VVGLGTQDTLSDAESFVRNYGTASFTMLWDESFETWSAFGIAAQPAALLFAADGRFIQGWMGPFDENEVISLARTAG